MSVNYEESNIKELKNKTKTNHISTQQKLPTHFILSIVKIKTIIYII